MKTAEQRFWPRVKRGAPDECWEWQGSTGKRGYGLFHVGPSGDGYARTAAHRKAWELTNGAIPDGLFVLHRCDNRLCCNPAHLFLGTQQDNIDDMDAKGRRRNRPLLGTAHPEAKLNDALIVEIRRRRADGEMAVTLAREYGVSDTLISRIASRRTWKHVP